MSKKAYKLEKQAKGMGKYKWSITFACKFHKGRSLLFVHWCRQHLEDNLNVDRMWNKCKTCPFWFLIMKIQFKMEIKKNVF